MSPRVIVCQIGAREHYIVPRLLHKAGLLKALVTDVWVTPGSSLARFPGRLGERLRGRYHDDLADARVVHFTNETLARKASTTLGQPTSRWNQMISHNAWFEARALRALEGQRLLENLDNQNGRPVLLAYSYAARDLLLAARAKGAFSLLGQIDGGESDELLISEIGSSRGLPAPPKAPAAYWERWHKECAVADRIIVNSDWSKSLLTRATVDPSKIVVVPIAFERVPDAKPQSRNYPLAFDHSRPLKVLFLGTAVARKGIIETLEAARLMANRPVTFAIVGADPDGLARAHVLPNVRYHGRVARERVDAYYAQSDVLLFPTHSDGFGMTQIEALAAGLPVIASRNCAALVQDGKTGILLPKVSGPAVVASIEQVLEASHRLPAMSMAARSFALESTAKARELLLNVVTAEQFGEQVRPP